MPVVNARVPMPARYHGTAVAGSSLSSVVWSLSLWLSCAGHQYYRRRCPCRRCRRRRRRCLCSPLRRPVLSVSSFVSVSVCVGRAAAVFRRRVVVVVRRRVVVPLPSLSPFVACLLSSSSVVAEARGRFPGPRLGVLPTRRRSRRRRRRRRRLRRRLPFIVLSSLSLSSSLSCHYFHIVTFSLL
jgi:hypothetical protein